MDLSYWEFDSYFNDVDITIIGSGIVGLSAALNIKLLAPQLKVLILERGMLPSGASTKNAGFACFGSPTELLDDLKNNNEEKVFALVEKRWRGLKRLRDIVSDKNMDYSQCGGYEIFTNTQEFLMCRDHLNYLNKKLKHIIGIEHVYQMDDVNISRFGFKQVQHMIVNTAEGQIHTGKMMLALTRKVQELGVIILNACSMTQFEPDNHNVSIQIHSGLRFSTKRLLFAVNGFAKQLLPDCPVIPGRSQVVITHPIPQLKFKGTFHFDKGYYYFRNVGNRVLFGGGRNLDFTGEETCEFGLTPQIQNQLEHHLRERILPGVDFQIQNRWSGIMGLGTKDKTFIVKKLQESVYCALRMGGMGIAVGSLVGEEAARLVLADS